MSSQQIAATAAAATEGQLMGKKPG